MNGPKLPTIDPKLAALLGLVAAGPFLGCTTALYGIAATPPVVVDGDGDGYTTVEDCDDSDPAIHPGADDPVGDGIDQDCDGVDGTTTDTGS
ncbi:MAG: putative metal-binding motif-containing protein [Myxococcota bacterium]